MADGIGSNMSIEGFRELRRHFDLLATKSQAALKQEVKAGALLVRARMLKLISEPGKGRTYRRRNVEHRASAPYDPPATDTGMLKARVGATSAISYSENGLQAEVGPRNYAIARYLEFGTRGIKPRPFIFKSLELERKNIVERIKRALLKELK